MGSQLTVTPQVAFEIGRVLQEEGIPGLREYFEHSVEIASRDSVVGLAKLLDELRTPRQAYTAAAEGDDAEIAAHAALRLGDLLRDSENTTAFDWYMKAVATEYADVSDVAAYNAGTLAEDAAPDVAERLYGRAASGSQPRVKASALLALGRMTRERERNEAVALFAAAAECDEPEVSPVAAFELADMLDDDSSPLAQEYLEAALGAADPTIAAQAGIRLGAAVDESNPELARRAYERALELPLDDAAAIVRVQLGTVLETLGRTSEAERSYRIAYDMREPKAWPWAAFRLALLHDPAAPAEAYFREAAGSGDDQVVPRARLALGKLLVASGRGEEGRSVLENLIDHPKLGIIAGVYLALSSAIDLGADAARACWDRVDGDPDARRYLLALLPELEGDWKVAAHALASDSTHPEIRGRVA